MGANSSLLTKIASVRNDDMRATSSRCEFGNTHQPPPHQNSLMKRAVRIIATGLAALGLAAYAGVRYAHRTSHGHPSTYVAKDLALRPRWIYLYPVRTTTSARAIVVLFGNDIAFWEPHQDLAWRLSGEGYTVVGVDVRQFLSTLPAAEPQRDSVFGPAIDDLIARARHELGGDSLPLVIGGHSFGAELAFWTALNRPPPRLVGVLSLNSRSRGHLFVTPADWLNEEATGPWSFSTVEAAAHIDPHVRIALVRSAHDPFRRHDRAFVAAGGARLRRFEVPMATHSLKTMLVAGPLISRAVRFLVDSQSIRIR